MHTSLNIYAINHISQLIPRGSIVICRVVRVVEAIGVSGRVTLNGYENDRMFICDCTNQYVGWARIIVWEYAFEGERLFIIKKYILPFNSLVIN